MIFLVLKKLIKKINQVLILMKIIVNQKTMIIKYKQINKNYLLINDYKL